MQNGSESPQVANQINWLCKQIIEATEKIDGLGLKIAECQRKYDGSLQETLIKLDHKKPMTDATGEEIVGCPTTIAEKTAKGLIKKDGFNLKIAEIQYKGCISKIENYKAVLNAKQSIYRHLSET